MFDKNNSYKSYKKSYKLESDNLNAEKHLNENTYLPKYCEGSKAILRTFTSAYLKKLLAKHFVINPFPGLLNPPEISFSYSRIISLLLLMILILANPVFAQTVKPSTVSLYAKAGSGDHYTLYSDGLAKESAYIGGFKSVQLDPLEENIYFYDTGLKIISKINLTSGKVSKVIGKPKSSTNTDFVAGSTFTEANLSRLKDFSFDKYGNIYVLFHSTLGDPNYNSKDSDPIILKASFKDSTVKQVMRIQDSVVGNLYLNGITSDNDKYFYLYGDLKYTNPLYPSNGQIAGQTVLRYDPSLNIIETYGISHNLTSTKFPYKFTFNQQNAEGLNVTGVAFDKLNNCYLSTLYTKWDYSKYKNISYPNINKINLTANSISPYINDGTGSADDIGDGGQAISGFASIGGGKCVCSDLNGDVLIADSLNNRIRKILKDGLIDTVAGSGTETLVFGQSKAAKSIALQSPGTLLVDKLNNLYIVEGGRILKATNLVTYVNQPIQIAKVANLAITKIAGNGVVNPLGDISMPDLALDYSYAGDQVVEVTAQNIPDGTNIKLTTTNADGSTAPNVPAAKLTNGVASIPVKIETGVSKVIKADTDPFVPAPGVYLPGTEPMIALGTLPEELPVNAPKRSEVNLTGNLLSSLNRFNFVTSAWRMYYQWATLKQNAALDPDGLANDVSYFENGTSKNLLYVDIPDVSTGMITFSVWARTDSGSVQVPITFTPACPDRSQPWVFSYSGWLGCTYQDYVANNNFSNPYNQYNTTTVNVDTTWKKITFTSQSDLNSINKAINIGGLYADANRKIYLWGARAEKTP